MRRTGHYLIAAGLLLAAVPATAAPTPEQKCEAGKNQAAGKYADCRQKAEAGLVKTGDITKYNTAIGKCETKFQDKWQKLIDAATAASATCPDAPLAASAYKDVIDEHSDNIAQALGGGGLEDCDADLATCTADLAACYALPAAQRLKTGQTLCYDAIGTPIACAGSGQDGEFQKGVARAYVDNGDGTVTDTKTGLMWEKLSDDGSIHDRDDYYTWTAAVTTKIATLNGGGGFAGYTDWRLPNINELQSLVNYGASSPAIDAAFNTACAASCTVTTCSCTVSAYYWSSTTTQDYPNFAWDVTFGIGLVVAYDKSGTNYVRAVRGGS
ncbi:DUF1566 domain-containing protein [Candidatus Binatia bacterium]|nr:DUF1566 domain-containing protein [Candidatus Binatia bacterium]